VALVTWDRSYSVNVKSCDAEHQKLFALINDLHTAMKSGKGRTVLADIVRELETYTRTHFLAEEALLQRARYPKFDEHRAQHGEFIARVQQFRNDLEMGVGGDSVAVLTFLRDWLAKHIKQTDRMYSQCLNSHGIN
jgi:hemerythrin-like metal-binding protein